MVTRYYEHDIFKEHVTPPGHPERVDRLRALETALTAEQFDTLDRQQAPIADESAILLAHPEEFLLRVKAQIPEEGIARIDADTVVCPQSLNAAMHGVGASMAAVDDVFSGAADNVFVASRPPGHHAEKNTAMGFCLFNNVAIAARHAQKKHDVERVAIIDWDVHHGNGTQDIFWDDPTVLYCSTHQMPLYPGTGAKGETGSKNTICNAPLNAGDGGDKFRAAFKDRVMPAVQNFEPDLIIISAGFDAHYRDPLAQLNLDDEDFDWATGRMMELADRFCSNRLISVLEGGYDLEGLAVSGAAHIHRMMRG
ncbi:histone deacetylase family protein [Ahrensia kielensis]|uniref:histone deacetylase family protein n=1 Tax=Ahrensia kielensis TaxID=76980 RepID=UPI000380B77F|nr:histone deacetylase family protein [Ahrensia kielensis]